MSYNPREMAFKLGDKLEIETSDSAELVARLAEFSPKELITASMELIKTEVRGGALDVTIFDNTHVTLIECRNSAVVCSVTLIEVYGIQIYTQALR